MTSFSPQTATGRGGYPLHRGGVFVLDGLPDGPVNRQLLASLLRYMGSAAFSPAVTLDLARVRGLLTKDTL